MSGQSLTDFFRQKTARAGAADIDWQRRKDEWLQAIDGLYSEVQRYLAPAVAAGDVRFDRRPKTITEDFMGSYQAPELVLRVGEEMVIFSPKGRNIVGGSGRVDLRGDRGEATLVLQPGPRWMLVAQRVPTARMIPLEEQSLLLALREVMRP